MLGEPPPVSRLRLDLRFGIVVRAGHPVLLDDEPAVVAVSARRRTPSRSTSPVPSSQKTPSRQASSQSVPRREDVEPHVLHVHVVDAVAPVAQSRDGIAAAAARWPVSRSSADVGALEQPLDLGRRLHARAHVGVEGRLEARARASSTARVDAVEVDVAVPRALVGEDRLRAEAARAGRASRSSAAKSPSPNRSSTKRAGELEPAPLEPRRAASSRRRSSRAGRAPCPRSRRPRSRRAPPRAGARSAARRR